VVVSYSNEGCPCKRCIEQRKQVSEKIANISQNVPAEVVKRLEGVGEKLDAMRHLFVTAPDLYVGLAEFGGHWCITVMVHDAAHGSMPGMKSMMPVCIMLDEETCDLLKPLGGVSTNTGLMPTATERGQA
jgi:hypothetical protein